LQYLTNNIIAYKYTLSGRRINTKIPTVKVS